MILYVIRHGETRLNKEGRLQGWTDEPLNENGEELARITGEALKKVPFDLVITSPLRRAKRTGELVVLPSENYYGKEVPVLEDWRLKELRWGSWEGLGCLADNFEIPSDNFDSFYEDAFHFEGAPDGESMQDVCKRADEFFQELIHNPSYQDKVILISTHGCTMRAMLNPAYEDKSSFWQEHVPYNCAVNIVEVKNGEAHVKGRDRIFYDESLCFDNYKAVK